MNYPFYIFDSNTEMEVLYHLFQMKEANQDKLEKNIAKLLLPMGGIGQSGLSYTQFMDKIARNREIVIPQTKRVFEKEKYLFEQMSQQNYERMSPEEKRQLKEQLLKEADKRGLSKSEVASMGSLVGIGAAQLSGFGIYMLASSTVASVAGLVGLTLPFAFYTTMSSVISVAIGPVGAILAAIPLYKTFKDVRSWDDLKQKGLQIYKGLKVFVTGNYELAEIIFSYIAATRLLKLEEFDNREKAYLDKVLLINEGLAQKRRLCDIEEQKQKNIEEEIGRLENQLQSLKGKRSEQIGICAQTRGEMLNKQAELQETNLMLKGIAQKKERLLQQ